MNNQGRVNSLPFYVASYDGRKTTIKRSPEYEACGYNIDAIRISINYMFVIQATINFIKKSYSALRSIESKDIRISATLPDYDDMEIEISEDTWADVVSGVKNINVSWDKKIPDPNLVSTQPINTATEPSNLLGSTVLNPGGSSGQHQNPTHSPKSVINHMKGNENTGRTHSYGTNHGLAPPDDITIHIICGSEQLAISTSISSTVGALRNLIHQSDRRHPVDPILSFPGTSILHDSRTLREYSITHGTTISMAANIQVYVAVNNGLRLPVTIALHSQVSSLKLLVSALLEIPVPDLWFACSGEQLEDHMRLGSYPQVVPGSDIVVGVTIGKLSRTRLCNTSVAYNQSLILWDPDWYSRTQEDLEQEERKVEPFIKQYIAQGAEQDLEMILQHMKQLGRIAQLRLLKQLELMKQLEKMRKSGRGVWGSSKQQDRIEQLQKQLQNIHYAPPIYQDSPRLFAILSVMEQRFLLQVVTRWSNEGNKLVASDSIRVLPSSTILDIKVLLFNGIIDRVPPHSQTIYYKGKALSDHKTVEKCGLKRGNRILVRMNRDVLQVEL